MNFRLRHHLFQNAKDLGTLATLTTMKRRPFVSPLQKNVPRSLQSSRGLLQCLEAKLTPCVCVQVQYSPPKTPVHVHCCIPKAVCSPPCVPCSQASGRQWAKQMQQVLRVGRCCCVLGDSHMSRQCQSPGCDGLSAKDQYGD